MVRIHEVVFPQCKQKRFIQFSCYYEGESTVANRVVQVVKY